MEAVKRSGLKAVDEAAETASEKRAKSKSRWFWPAGVIAAGVTGAAVVMMRGCWHRKMSWPLSVHGSSYRVCLGCGIKRLFDEPTFTSYGPYSYDLNDLNAWDRAHPHSNPAAKRAS